MLLSFSEEMRRIGMTPGAQVINTELVDPPEQAAVHLMVAQGEKVLRIERVRYADNAPISYAVDQIPAWVGLSPDADFSGSLYQLLAAVGVYPEESVHTIEAALADMVVAHRLEIPAGSPVLHCQDTTYDATGRPINYGLAIWRADRYSYTVKLKAGKPKPS